MVNKMNIQSVFDALKEDQDNSAIGIICAEFEKQGYNVIINNKSVSSLSVFDGEHKSLENTLDPLEISLIKDGVIEQKFFIEFVEFHEIIIKSID